ncbi:MAG: helix-turn-helix domain-containing protein [Actinomycetaceae bacterium]|nr:helix-turn-helix domain-containing protein [Actinomycetaceae bacterium]MDY6082556.1 helix-turn-helix domain-containing protein [Actinomycetaceae bacterium]
MDNQGKPRQNVTQLTIEIVSVIADLRDQAGLENTDLSEKTGISTSSLSRMFTGKRVPDINEVELLASVFALRTSDIIERAEDRLASAASTTQPDESALSVEFTDPAAYDAAVQAKLAAIEQGDYDFAAYTPEITEPDENDDTYWEPA